jgi:hypothetical protein
VCEVAADFNGGSTARYSDRAIADWLARVPEFQFPDKPHVLGSLFIGIHILKLHSVLHDHRDKLLEMVLVFKNKSGVLSLLLCLFRSSTSLLLWLWLIVHSFLAFLEKPLYRRIISNSHQFQGAVWFKKCNANGNGNGFGWR